jgi:hypothetical protein
VHSKTIVYVPAPPPYWQAVVAEVAAVKLMVVPETLDQAYVFPPEPPDGVQVVVVVVADVVPVPDTVVGLAAAVNGTGVAVGVGVGVGV